MTAVHVSVSCAGSDALLAAASQASFRDTPQQPKTNCIRMRSPRSRGRSRRGMIQRSIGSDAVRGPVRRVLRRKGEPVKIDALNSAVPVCGMALDGFLYQYARRCVRFCGRIASILRRPWQR
ncbi:ribonuclease HI [Trypanosoma cruzi]|nr:ribonuclease HI [Trypanosoma cruzi]